VKTLYFKFEEFQITKAIGLPFHGFDFVVGAFEGPVDMGYSS
jgi:hypothetical protein